jgi:hypothetical protein
LVFGLFCFLSACLTQHVCFKHIDIINKIIIDLCLFLFFYIIIFVCFCHCLTPKGSNCLRWNSANG